MSYIRFSLVGTSISDDDTFDTNITSSTGIIPRAVDQIFNSLVDKSDYSVKNSFIEIYNEDLIDLLTVDKPTYSSEKTPVTIREASNGTIIWSGLKESNVNSSNDVLKNLRIGTNVRKTNETEMNSQSSRSHAIFSLTLTQKKYVGSGQPPSTPKNNRPVSGIARVTSPTFGRPSTPTSFKSGLRPPSSLGTRSPSPTFNSRDDDYNNDYVTITSKFHFVDLAGSERLKRTAAQGTRASEAISINSGLLALGNVISALGDPSKARARTYIPYRDSKLTRLLQDSLGGNSQTTMIACVSPAEFNTNETINTLKYANRARNIKNKAEVNQVEAGWEDIEYLQNTIIKLRKELSIIKNGKGNINVDDVFNDKSRVEFEDLESKYEASTSELERLKIQLSNTSNDDSPNLNQKANNFAQMVAPVIEEYERTINTLESELKLTKAAVTHTNMVYNERENEFDELIEKQSKDTNAINELQTRLQKLLNREQTTEAYVRDLELQVKTLTEGDETSSAALSGVRKDLIKHREQEATSEQYIFTLESKLSSCEKVNNDLLSQVEKLEKEANERDETLKTLQERIALFDDNNEKQALLDALDESNTKIQHNETRLEDLMTERVSILKECEELKRVAKDENSAREEAQNRLNEIEKSKLNKPNLNGIKEFTPPNTPENRNSYDENMLQNEINDLRNELQQIQTSHKKTLSELENVSSRYRDALKEIGELTGQREESKVNDDQQANNATHIVDKSTGKLRRKLSFESGGITLPNSRDGRRNSLNIPRRNSIQNLQQLNISTSPNGNLARSSAFFGRAPLVTSPGATTTPTSGGHSRAPSLLLSQELSSSRGSRSSWAGPPSPGISPRLSLNNLQVQNGNSERSIQSLEREIQTLQKTLKDREDEITLLEKELPQLKQTSSTTENKKVPNSTEKSADINEEHLLRYNELMR